MSRYHPVKPRKGKKHRQQQETQHEELSYEERYRKSVDETADAIYQKNGGDSIDAAIRRAERTLALYEKDLDALDNSDDPGRRWKITPTAALQWQRELERQQKRKDDLYKECWGMARKLVDEWMAEKAQQQGTQPQPPAEDFHQDETRPSISIERRQADAGHSAA
ncbi:MAG: hypothetical protein KDB82_05720 [Planctomycetes bacterium]|nr:hypothetical protein [Planctomycetota bacterium]